MTDLTSIINSWKKSTREHEVNEVQKAVLDVFNKNRSDTLRQADIVRQVKMNGDLVTNTITELNKRRFLYTRGVSARTAPFEIDSNGIEVYESEYDIFSKIITVMKNHQTHIITSSLYPHSSISTPDITIKTNLGRYRLANFYAFKLVNSNPCIVIPRSGTIGKREKEWLLTKTGEELADHLNLQLK